MSALYGKAREKFLAGTLSWTGSTVKAVLVDTADYVVAPDTHEFLSDVPAGARVAVSPALAGKTATLGVADADDVSFAAVAGDTAEALVLYADTGTEGTSALIAYIDGITLTPNGAAVNVAWDNGANRIFKL